MPIKRYIPEDERREIAWEFIRKQPASSLPPTPEGLDQIALLKMSKRDISDIAIGNNALHRLAFNSLKQRLQMDAVVEQQAASMTFRAEVAETKLERAINGMQRLRKMLKDTCNVLYPAFIREQREVTDTDPVLLRVLVSTQDDVTELLQALNYDLGYFNQEGATAYPQTVDFNIYDTNNDEEG